MSIIYCDESGNSGERLLDKDQPFFVLASNDFGVSEAKGLLEHVRSPQGGEPKFKTLKKTQEGIRRLTRFFADPRLHTSRIVVDVYHKRYMVVTKLVDLVVETLMHRMGEDLYKDGANIAMSNMLYGCMPTFCGDELTDRFLQSFVDLMRHRTNAHVTEYFDAGRAMVEACCDDDFQKTLLPFAEPSLFAAWFNPIGDMALEPAIPALFQHLSEWGRRKPDRFRVIHDGSKPVLASQEDFQRMMALVDESSRVVGYDRRKFQFPLRAVSLEQGDSMMYPQIQVADLCAGAINHFLKCHVTGELDELAEVVRGIGCLNWVINGVVPSTDVSPEDLGTDSDDGENPLDAFCDYVHTKGSTSGGG
jgi:hypothetical protein